MAHENQNEATVIDIRQRRSAKACVLNGVVKAPVSAPASGFMGSLTFLDENGFLRAGDSLVSALNRAGVCLKDQVTRTFEVAQHGLFEDGQMTDKGKELFQVLADEGFEGSIKYLADGYEQELFLSGGHMRSSEDMMHRRVG